MNMSLDFGKIGSEDRKVFHHRASIENFGYRFLIFFWEKYNHG